MLHVLQAVQDSGQQVLAAARKVITQLPGTSLTQALSMGLLAGLLTYHLMKKRYRLPPGPRPWPLLGNLLWMSRTKKFYLTLEHWAREKYGPVISVYFGPKLCVTLNDLDTVTEALVQKGNDYAGRPHLHSFYVATEGNQDIFLSDYSPAWKLYRKIAVKAIRNYMTGTHFEQTLHEVMAKVTPQMAAEPGPFDPSPHLSNLMFHILDTICFGEAKPINDPSIQQLISALNTANDQIGNGFFEDVIPLLKYWPTKRFQKFQSSSWEILEYIEANVQKHRQSFSADRVRDVTDAILVAQREVALEERAEDMAMFTDVHVRQIINDLFGAGTDTSRHTLSWALLYMAGHPEIQKKAQAEIDTVTGTEMPGIRHRSQLHYTQAVMQETMRLGCMVPLALPHMTLCDTSVGGYEVPKGTMVLVNLWAVTHDPKLWEDPDSFKPERFLDNQGQQKPLPKAWIPFSAGRRVCLGESVAKPELLLLLACFLKRFIVSLPKGVTYNPTGEVGTMPLNPPMPYKIVVTPR